MKALRGSRVLCALLALVAIGMGVQTYYLVKVHRQLGGWGTQVTEAVEGPIRGGPNGENTGAPPSREPAPRNGPVAHLEEAEARMRSLFDEFYERFDGGLGDPWHATRPFLSDRDPFLFGPLGDLEHRVDLEDRGDRYEMRVDVPGADQAEVVVRTEGRTLVVESTRRSASRESEPGRHARRERHFGKYERRLSLPADADPESLRTRFEEGVLRVTLDKRS